MSLVFSVILSIVYFALLVVFIAMWVRFVFDWVQVLNPNFRPRGLVVVVAETSYTLTDPPIKAVRRVLPPLQLGGVRLDLAWTIVLFALLLLMSLVRVP